MYLQLTVLFVITVPLPAAERTNPGKGDFGINLAKYEYGYWSPEIRELHIHVTLNTDQFAEDELLKPYTVFVNGKEPLYTYWIVDGVRFDDNAIHHVNKKKVELYIPFAWSSGEINSITLMYQCGIDLGSLVFEAPAPGKGGFWEKSNGGNQIFRVCEEAGLDRRNEPVEFDITIQESVFRDPDLNLRATLMTSPGTYQEIPCQVYDVEHLFGCTGLWSQEPVVRFRATVQLSLKARAEAMVVLWDCPDDPSPRIKNNITMKSAVTTDTLVENDFYRVRLSPKSGQLFSWFDKQRSMEYRYDDPRDLPDDIRPINRTPGIFVEGREWSHAFDWNPGEYMVRSIKGPVFCENIRWGSMHNVPEAEAHVRYRFYADRPEIHLESSVRIVEDCRAYALRNQGMIFSNHMFTHAAWPLPNGKIKTISLELAKGNDTGSPPIANAPVNTPWMALYNTEKGYGMAIVTAGSALFNNKGQHPNRSRTKSYVSVYRDKGVYTIRAANLTYLSDIYTLITPLHEGTTMYEKMVLFPFSSGKGSDPDFSDISARYDRILHPLIIVP